MGYLVNSPYDISAAERVARHDAYLAYLQSARSRMPQRAFEFAAAPWHYDRADHRCPHDAWVRSLTIQEPAPGQRHEERGLEISVELLGAYHDGYIRLTYPGVCRYSLFQSLSAERGPRTARGHGDWVVDEVSASDNGRPGQLLIVHEIAFSRQGVWTIEAEDLAYEWLPR